MSVPVLANGQMVLPASFKVVLYCCDGCMQYRNDWRHVYVRLWVNKCVFICTLISDVYCVVSLTLCVCVGYFGRWLWLAVVACFGHEWYLGCWQREPSPDLLSAHSHTSAGRCLRAHASSHAQTHPPHSHPLSFSPPSPTHPHMCSHTQTNINSARVAITVHTHHRWL